MSELNELSIVNDGISYAQNLPIEVCFTILVNPKN